MEEVVASSAAQAKPEVGQPQITRQLKRNAANKLLSLAVLDAREIGVTPPRTAHLRRRLVPARHCWEVIQKISTRPLDWVRAVDFAQDKAVAVVVVRQGGAIGKVVADANNG